MECDHTLSPLFTTDWLQVTSPSSSDYPVNQSDSNTQNCRVVSQKLAYIPWDNPDNIITLETTYLIAKILDGVIAPLVAFAGLPINALNCLVFYKLGVRDRINLLLFCQAFFDFLVELTVFLHSVEYFYTLVAGNFQVYGPWMTFKQNNGINTMYGFVYVSAFMFAMIACERCLCITHPFTAKRILKPVTASVVIAIVTVILVGVHYIISDKYRIGCVHYTELNVTVKGYIPSKFYLQHHHIVDILNSVLYGFGLPSFFVITTIITTIITTVKLKTAAAWRQQMSSVHQADRNEVAVTKMLIAVSCLFVVCTIPMVVARFMPVFVPGLTLGGRYQNLFMGCVGLIHVTPAINSCLNFFFYFRMGSKFRQTLKLLCCGDNRK